MKTFNISVEYVNDLFSRARQLIHYIVDENPQIDWFNNDVIYKVSADWKNRPIHYCVSGLKYEEYSNIVHTQNYYVLFGIAESFYEFGFTLVYDIVDRSNMLDRPALLLKLYRGSVLVCAETITTWRV